MYTREYVFFIWSVARSFFLFLVRLAEASSTVVFFSLHLQQPVVTVSDPLPGVSLTDKHLNIFSVALDYYRPGRSVRYWFLKMTGKSVKDIDRYQAVLTSLLASEENKFCADCHAKGKIHISWELCIEQLLLRFPISAVRKSVFVYKSLGLGPVCFTSVWLVVLMSDS